MLHSSVPVEPSLAVKKTRLPTDVNKLKLELDVPGRMSINGLVPAIVPSENQGSTPVATLAVITTPLPSAAWTLMLGLLGKSVTRVVPPTVPSLVHSSRPKELLAPNQRRPLATTNGPGLELPLPP